MDSTHEPEDELLDGLTGPQREAVLRTEGPVLVLAAAGSGKTRVITRRIAYLIRRCGVPPWQVLALTFTNKAAGEMRERVLHLLGGEGTRLTRGLTVTTFHSLCARLLRRYAEPAQIPGLKPDYTIYDTGDQQSLMKRVLGELGLTTSNWPPRTVLGAISNAKNELLDAEAFAARATDFYSKQVAKIYDAYSRAMRLAGAIDFDDLLLLTARMLRERPEIAGECRERWRYMMIDEYQDTNRAQFSIAGLLARDPEVGAAAAPNVCVVGDPDQAIYGWRGADLGNILDFEEHFPSAHVVKLGENFRSTEPILAIADGLIKHNTRRKDKPLFTSRPGGEPVTVVQCRDERQEATLVADWFEGLRRPENAGGGPALSWKDMAVLYRTNALSRTMEDALRAAGVPYTIARGTAFFEREEIKHALAYLRVVANPDDDVSLDRIINTPARGIGKATMDAVEASARRAGVSLMTALRDAAANGTVSGRAATGLAKFVEMIDSFAGQTMFMGASVEARGSLADLVARVVRESGLEDHYRKLAAKSEAEADGERLDNLDELISSARQFEDEYDPANDPVIFPATGRRADAAPSEDDEFDPFGAGDLAASAADDQELAQQAASDVNADAFAGVAVPPLLGLLRAYLESVALIADADAVDPANGAVTLMTLHAAKGLEFGAVAMVGLEEGLLPHSRSFDSEAALEEERRLMFVGITRAMRHLHITCSKYRTLRGVPERTIASRFLAELDREHIVMSDRGDDDSGSGWIDEHSIDPDPWAESVGRTPRSGARPGDPRGPQRAASGPAWGSGAVPGGADSAAMRAFPPGARVRHPQFGEGTVVTVSGGANARAVIEFRHLGRKTLVLEYARLHRIG